MDSIWEKQSDDFEFEDVEDGNFLQDSFSYDPDSSFYEDLIISPNQVNSPVKQEGFHFELPSSIFGQVKQNVTIKQESLPVNNFMITPTTSQFYNSLNFISKEDSLPYKKIKSSIESTLQTEIDIKIDCQPPVEVRTRTPSEIRTFSVVSRVLGRFRSYDASIMKVVLSYALNSTSPKEVVKKDILGGTKTVALSEDGSAIFDNLWISESSTKHKEREFCIEFVLLSSDGNEIMRKETRPFYAYSHKKVLQRRVNVKLRTLSKTWGKFAGGDQMHVIGSPFIQGPALSLIFRTPHGDVTAKPLEYFSDSVIFFELPPYPLPDGIIITPDTEVKVQVLLTNDGRTYSNPMDFNYIADNTPRSRI
jgi:hypothetical protein